MSTSAEPPADPLGATDKPSAGTGAVASPWARATPREVRLAIRSGEISGPTVGMALGFAQANLVILPADIADEFGDFCAANPRPCPLLERTAIGDPHPREMAYDADLRTDVPRYRVFRDGQLSVETPGNVTGVWREDLVGFLLGCSFTFESALLAAGIPLRHVALGKNVAMYRTSRECQPAGRFAGPLVVSMRPLPEALVSRAIEITASYSTMHGAPIHVGDPAELGIADLAQPDFGEAVPILPGEVPVFWACGVTPQLALAAARPSMCVTHAPGCMFVTDLRDSCFGKSAARPGSI